jgi:hypothetical protein
LAVLFLLAYIPLSILFINRYFDLRHIHFKQSEKVSTLQKKVMSNQKALLKSRDHAALLEEYIRRLEKGETEETQTAEEEKSQDDRAGKIVASTRKQGEALPKTTDIVSIEDMVIKKQDSRITVDFRLVNVQQGEDPVGGYVHIIAKAEGADTSNLRTFPYERLINGMPENYRRGQLFLIQRFKPIKGRFDLTPNADPPSIFQVLVYDQSGLLILEEGFEANYEP